MSSYRYTGYAAAVAQVSTIQITAVDGTPSNTVYKIAIGNKVVSVAGITSVNATAAALQAALAASTFGEFLEVTWTVLTDTVTGTAVTAGKPFTAVSSKTGGTGTIGAVTVATASAGPNDWSTAANFTKSDGTIATAIPTNGDDVTLDLPVQIKYGFNQSAVTLTALTILPSFSASGQSQLGLPQLNQDGTAYPEYRPYALKIGATILNVNTDAQLLRFDLSSIQSTVTVLATGTSSESGVPAMTVKGTHASNVVDALSGSVGIAFFADEVATVLNLRVNGATVSMGSGMTLTTVTTNDGALLVQNAVSTLTVYGGQVVVLGSGAITTLNSWGGSVAHAGTGTISTLTVGGVVQFSSDTSRVVSACTGLRGGSLAFDPHTTTFTNPIQLPGIGLNDFSINVTQNISVQFAGL